jgi:polyisoprenoid-binding protein YceI
VRDRERGAGRGAALCLAAALSHPASLGAAVPEPGAAFAIDGTTASVGFDLPATLHTVHGRGRAVSGWVAVGERGPERELALDGAVHIDAASLDTGNRKRDRKMHAESLAVGAHPRIEFAPRSLGPALDRCPPDTAADASCWPLGGELTIRGVTRAITFPVAVRAVGERLVVDGKVELRWADFGVPDPSVLLLKVKPRVQVAVHVELVPRPDG